MKVITKVGIDLTVLVYEGKILLCLNRSAILDWSDHAA